MEKLTETFMKNAMPTVYNPDCDYFLDTSIDGLGIIETNRITYKSRTIPLPEDGYVSEDASFDDVPEQTVESKKKGVAYQTQTAAFIGIFVISVVVGIVAIIKLKGV